MKRLFALSLLATMSLGALASPITEVGVGTGNHGAVEVSVTFDHNRIQAIDVLKSHENKILSAKVFTDMKAAMIEHNSVDVDTIAGATVSSKALKQAVLDAAKKAGVTLNGPVVVPVSYTHLTLPTAERV